MKFPSKGGLTWILGADLGLLLGSAMPQMSGMAEMGKPCWIRSPGMLIAASET